MMEREIIFRGKRVSDGKWAYGSLVLANHFWHEHGKHKEWIVTSAFANGGRFAVSGRYAVDGNTVGQYTGLEWNTKIFEGDILRLRDLEGNAWTSEIFFDKNVACFAIKTRFNQCYPLYNVILNAHMGKISVELVGNVYDNPDILEKETGEIK